MGIEREGFGGNHLAITVTMTDAATSESLAGIYAASFAEPVRNGVGTRANRHKRRAIFHVTNTGNQTDSYHLTKRVKNLTRRPPSPPNSDARPRVAINYFLNGRNMTAAFRANRVHATLDPDETARVVARVRPRGGPLNHKRRIRVTSVAACDASPAVTARCNIILTLPARRN